MKNAHAILHAVSLGACLALGAGFWQLKKGQPPVAAQSRGTRRDEASVPPRIPDPELESLRLRVAELEARLPFSQAAPAGDFTAPPSQDGAFDAKLLEAGEKEKSLVQGGGGTITLPSPPRKPAGFEGMDLSDLQKEALEKILAESKAFTNDLLRRRARKEALPEQLKTDLERHRAEADAMVRGLLSAEQYAQFQDRMKGPRGMTDRMFSSKPGKELSGASPFRGSF